MFTFLFGFATASIIFIIFGVKNQKKIDKMRVALINSYEWGKDKGVKITRGIDKKIDSHFDD